MTKTIENKVGKGKIAKEILKHVLIPGYSTYAFGNSEYANDVYGTGCSCFPEVAGPVALDIIKFSGYVYAISELVKKII